MNSEMIESMKSEVEKIDAEILRLDQVRKSFLAVIVYVGNLGPVAEVFGRGHKHVLDAIQSWPGSEPPANAPEEKERKWSLGEAEAITLSQVAKAGKAGLSGKAIAEASGIHEKRMARILRRLVAEKKLRRTGERRTTRYTVRKGR